MVEENGGLLDKVGGAVSHFLNEGFSESEGSKLFKQYTPVIKSIENAAKQYESLPEDSPERTALGKKILRANEIAEQMERDLEIASYDFSDYLNTGVQAASESITFGLDDYLPDGRELGDEVYDLQSKRVWSGTGVTGGILGDNLAEEAGGLALGGGAIRGAGRTFDNVLAGDLNRAVKALSNTKPKYTSGLSKKMRNEDPTEIIQGIVEKEGLSNADARALIRKVAEDARKGIQDPKKLAHITNNASSMYQKFPVPAAGLSSGTKKVLAWLIGGATLTGSAFLGAHLNEQKNEILGTEDRANSTNKNQGGLLD